MEFTDQLRIRQKGKRQIIILIIDVIDTGEWNL